MDDGYIHLVQTPEKLVCLEKKEFGSMEKVSIIVPVYNAEKHFERFIRCIRKQTYVNLEVLLIDDGSTDGSAALCDRYAAEDARIRAIHLPHAGVARARNRGLEEYTGKYLMFADIDDLLAKNYVSRLYELITHSEEHVVTCIAHDTRKTDLQKYEYKGKKQWKFSGYGLFHYELSISEVIVYQHHNFGASFVVLVGQQMAHEYDVGGTSDSEEFVRYQGHMLPRGVGQSARIDGKLVKINRDKVEHVVRFVEPGMYFLGPLECPIDDNCDTFKKVCESFSSVQDLRKCLTGGAFANHISRPLWIRMYD